MDAGDFFNEGIARRELKRYRRRGPSSSTRRLLALLREVRELGLPDDGAPAPVDLLDIGGGVGAVPHEFIRAGAGRVVVVDASPAYLQAVAREAERQGTRECFTLVQGDAVDRAGELPRAATVTLDRVLCCYPDLPALVAVSASRAAGLWGVVYPREWWGVRLGVWLVNLYQRLRGRAFRVYLHGPGRIAREAGRHGLALRTRDRTLLWTVEVYARAGASGPPSGTAPSTTTAAAM